MPELSPQSRSRRVGGTSDTYQKKELRSLSNREWFEFDLIGLVFFKIWNKMPQIYNAIRTNSGNSDL